MYRDCLFVARRGASKVTAAMIFTALASSLMLPLNSLAGDDTSLAKPLGADSTPQEFIQHAEDAGVDIHDLFFSLRPYESTESCIMCHESEALEMLNIGHFKWSGTVENIVGLEGQQIGKRDLLNNFCIAVPSNEGRCTQCHVGLGWTDASFDFNNPANVDCLVCHDQSGSYMKGLTSGGLPDPSVDLQAVARSIAIGSRPTRKACIGCHAAAGGGDNVKHGDLSSDMVSPTRDHDVHMGVDGANLVCVDCHGANHDPETGEVNHGIPGLPLHSVHEGEMKVCSDCHGKKEAIHAGTSADDLFAEDRHQRLACQVCHIPVIAKGVSTKVEWYWADAGQNISPIPVDATGRATYDKKKGTFYWANNLRPTLRWANGKWERKVIGLNDTYDAEPIEMAKPVGSYEDPTAMIYPFKMMVGNQPVDKGNKKIIVPHLFGLKGGQYPYWGKFDWNLALSDGAVYTGQPYSGNWGFASTNMLLTVNHEVAPAEQALGMGGMGEGCVDCHAGDVIDWPALGWTRDPFDGGQRITTAAKGLAPLTSVND